MTISHEVRPDVNWTAVEDMASGPLTLLITGDDGTTRVVALAGRDLRIGRSLENDVVLPDANKGVSRTHAELRVERGRYVIVDLQSQNGTWVNGERVERAAVPDDAEIAIGLYRLRLQTGAATDIADLPLGRVQPVSAGISSSPHSQPGGMAAGSGAVWFQKPALFAGGAAAGIVAFLLVRALTPSPVMGPSVRVPATTTIDTKPLSSDESTRPAPSPESVAQPQETGVVGTPENTDAPTGQSSVTAAVPAGPIGPGMAGDRGAARDAFDVGSKLDLAGDWVGALHKYDQARQFDPSLPGLNRAVKQAWEKMRVAGRSALNRAREYDAIGQSADALKEYDKAAHWLPPDDPNRAVASGRADELRAGVK